MSDFAGIQAEAQALMTETLADVGTDFLREKDSLVYRAFVRGLSEGELVALELQGTENARDLQPHVLDFMALTVPLLPGDYIYMPAVALDANRHHVTNIRTRFVGGGPLCQSAVVVRDP